MVMKVNEQEYLPWVDIAMMSIYVHDYNSLVFSESLSFDSIPGAVAVLKIAKVGKSVVVVIEVLVNIHSSWRALR